MTRSAAGSAARRFRTVVLALLSIALPLVAPARAADAQNPFQAPVVDVRPRIFIRKDSFDGLTIDKLRQAAASPEFASARDKWKSNPKGRAILWLIEGKQDDLEAAIAGLKKMKADGSSWSDRGLALVDLAATFDWLYDKLDEPTRRDVIARIEQAADAGVQHILRGQAPFFYSRTPGALAGVGVAGLALHGVSEKARGYLDLIRTWGVNDFFKAMQWVDGAATGATYSMYYTYVDLPQFCAAWWSATGQNPNPWIRANQGDWLEGIVRFYLWSMRPGFAFLDINDQYRDTYASHDQFCRGLDAATYVTRSGQGRAWAQRWLGKQGSAVYHTAYAHAFLFRDPSIAERSLTELPTAELFGRESCGYGFFRSHWPAPGRPDDATHVFFRMGDPMNVHGGVSAGEFQVFRYAPLAWRSGKYGSYDSPPDQYHRNAVSTNVLLFTDPAKAGDRGDQETRRGLKSDHKTWNDWLEIRKRSGHDVAAITDWQVAPDLSRCRADLSKTNPTRCKQWVRELVWLGRKHLVVLDVVETARPDVVRRWQLHLPARPELSQRTLSVTNRPPDRTWAQPQLKPKTEQARLFCQTLLPRDYTLILHADGKAEGLDPAGKAKPAAAAGNDYHLKFGKVVAQIEPAASGTQTLFLHVLTACDAEGAKAPQAACRLAGPGKLAVTVDGQAIELVVPDWAHAD